MCHNTSYLIMRTTSLPPDRYRFALFVEHTWMKATVPPYMTNDDLCRKCPCDKKKDKIMLLAEIVIHAATIFTLFVYETFR